MRGKIIVKKFLLVISLISLVLLTGCTNDKNNNLPENTDNQQKTSENNDVKEIEKYKLSDSYELSGAEYCNLFNVGIDDYITYAVENIKNRDLITIPITDWRELVNNINSYNFESNGKSYNIKCTNTRDEQDGQYSFDIQINDEKIKFADEYRNEDDYKHSIYAIGVIDIDPTDNLKEIIIRERGEVFIKTIIFRLNDNDELEEFHPDNLSYYNVLCVNNKIIFPVYLYSDYLMYDGPVIGYYTYDNGKLVYIDRLLNGEKSIDDNGNLVIEETLKFGSDYGWIIDTLRDPNLDSEYENKLRCKILSVKVNREIRYQNEYDSLTYDIELLDDAVRYRDDGTLENLPKGTILKDVSIDYGEC